MQATQHSSLPIKHREQPYATWIQLAQDNKEIEALVKVFRMFPRSWIEWTERQVIAREMRSKHQNRINKPIPYRLSVLWTSIITLQESKFICDIVENTLRQNVAYHLAENRVCYQDVCIQNLGNAKKHLSEPIVPEQPVNVDIITYLSFGDLVKTIEANWNHFGGRPEYRNKGLKMLFIRNKKCQEIVFFREEMGIIRAYRNNIAHSSNLMRRDDAQKLYDKAVYWLTPLRVDLQKRIEEYRLKRPNFLINLETKSINSAKSV